MNTLNKAKMRAIAKRPFLCQFPKNVEKPPLSYDVRHKKEQNVTFYDQTVNLKKGMLVFVMVSVINANRSTRIPIVAEVMEISGFMSEHVQLNVNGVIVCVDRRFCLEK